MEIAVFYRENRKLVVSYDESFMKHFNLRVQMIVLSTKCEEEEVINRLNEHYCSLAMQCEEPRKHDCYEETIGDPDDLFDTEKYIISITPQGFTSEISFSVDNFWDCI